MAIDTETLAFVNKDLPTPQRLHAFNKDAKIILCVRDPGDWALSLYRQISTFDGAVPSFEEFLSGKYTLIEDSRGLPFNMCSGDIAKRVEEYKTLFAESILILKFSDVTKYPLEALRKIENHLGLDCYYNDENIFTDKINSSDRSHSKILNKILRNEFMIKIIKFLVPRKGVLYIRLAFDRISAGFSEVKNNHEGDCLHSLRDIASKYYKYDIERLSDYM
ncbi:sulfotransferase domain protein [mine drainage metagenome]|uniref:Sulfotransferase domain protein n=1 Tax=mine drainage metagenome TaxID=410659 RepID=A0A1J5RTB8_9ZZZZ